MGPFFLLEWEKGLLTMLEGKSWDLRKAFCYRPNRESTLSSFSILLASETGTKNPIFSGREFRLLPLHHSSPPSDTQSFFFLIGVGDGAEEPYSKGRG